LRSAAPRPDMLVWTLERLPAANKPHGW